MYRLSELYGFIGQVLKDEGDMPIQRFQDLSIDGVLLNRDNYIDFSNTDFVIVEEDFGSKKRLEKHFIVNIPKRK